jgi:hypothetical protein
LHLRAQDPIEHPDRNLTTGALVVIVQPTPVHTTAALQLADDDDFLAVERMPAVVHPAYVGPVISVIGTCTTLSGPTRAET